MPNMPKSSINLEKENFLPDNHSTMVVMLWAWLGLKALAWAWPERAWA